MWRIIYSYSIVLYRASEACGSGSRGFRAREEDEKQQQAIVESD